MENQGGKPPLNRRERRLQQREQQKQEKHQKIGRRALIPGTGIIDLIRAKGDVSKLSRESQVSLGKDAAIVAVATGIGVKLLSLEQDKRTFKEKVTAFSWEDAKDKEKLKNFTEILADEYLRLTKTPRVQKEDLVGTDKTTFYNTSKDYLDSVRRVNPKYTQTTPLESGYTHFESKKVFIDLEKTHSNLPKVGAGLSLIHLLWHEWGHLDVESRNHGFLIKNPDYFFDSPVSGQSEQFKSYRGATVHTDTYYGFERFEEVLNETINRRRLVEEVGLEPLPSAYDRNGVDLLPKFTTVSGISLKQLYDMHAASDFEGLGSLIGGKLPGQGDPLSKGRNLFIGIHDSDPQIIQQTGVFNVSGMR